MVRKAMAALLVVCCVQAAQAQAQAQQAAWRFRWQTGQVLNYRVEQQTTFSEVVGDKKLSGRTNLKLTKRWQVLAVDDAGVATLQHSLTALRMEMKTPTGETLLFDSANPDKSDPQLREQLSRFVGVPLSKLRVDALGKVVEVKEAKFGPASRFEAEPPFLVTLPGAAVRPGQTWQRVYKITLEPPAGTGEKYDAVQQYACKSDGVIRLTTQLKTQPKALADRIPLLQFQPEGEVVFDVRAGRLHSARLQIKKELKGHQGAGSSYTFQSTYTEQFVAEK